MGPTHDQGCDEKTVWASSDALRQSIARCSRRLACWGLSYFSISCQGSSYTLLYDCQASEVDMQPALTLIILK